MRIDGVEYPIRIADDGLVEVKIRNAWRSQRLFCVTDHESLQAVVEILVLRHGKRSEP